MRPITYSWIGQCAAAPLVFLASAWVLGVFHSYRRHWLSVDLFLLAISAQELLMALQVFVFSLLSLVRPDWDGACGALVWSLNATRALQLATVASLLADRALTCHWPYRYRFSVRRHQLRYHLAVLAAMAALLGVAALIARPQHPSSFPDCATMPHLLHIRLALFLLAVYGALLLVGIISAAVVQTSRGCRSTKETPELAQHITNTTSSTASSNRPPPSTSSLSSHGRPLQTSASTASSTSSTGISAGMRAASSTADLLPSSPPSISRPSVLRSSNNSSPGGSDFRWSTCVSVAALCCCVNHIPYLSVTMLGTFVPSYLPSWAADHLVLWLCLLEGALLPLLLVLADAPFRRGAGSSCSRAQEGGARHSIGKPHPNLHHSYRDGEGPFRLFPKEEAKVFPLTNGSLFSSLLTLPVVGGVGGDHYHHHPHPHHHHHHHQPPQLHNHQHHYKKDGAMMGLRMGISHGGLRALDLRKLRVGRSDTPYGAPYYCGDTAGGSLASLTTTSQQDPLYSDPTNKTTSSVDSSLKEDHIYATLSETFGSMSSFSDGCINDDNRCPSVTTVANDDFEFHDPRTSGCSSIGTHPMGVSRNHCARQQSCSGSSFSSASGLPSFGMRMRDDDDTLVLNSAVNPNVTTRPPAELPPEAYAQVHVINSDDSINNDAFVKTESDLVMEKNRQNMMNSIREESPVSPQIGYNNYVFESDTLEKKYYMQKHSNDTLETKKREGNYNMKEQILKEDISDGTLSRKHRVSSLSMNDLDRFDKEKQSDPEEQMMFLLPVKSESMLSLYRLYLAEDEQDSSASLHYSIELSKSENDLSIVNEEQESISIGRSSDDIHHQTSHEIYQKRRRPQSSASKIRRQHKIQRAKGLHMKNKPQIQAAQSQSQGTVSQSNTGNPNNSPSRPVVTNVIDGTDYGVQVAIMDKTRRQNGIITIRDPSGLSVQELFSVLNRATASAAERSAEPNRLDDYSRDQNRREMNRDEGTKSRVDSNSVTTIPIPDHGYKSLNETPSLPCSANPHTEFKKIFVSEYL